MSVKKHKKDKKPFLPTFFEKLAYLSTTLQWLWLGVIFLPLLLKSEALRTLFLPAEKATQEVTTVVHPAAETSPIAFYIAVVVAVVFIILTIIVLIKLPGSIAKTGRKAAATTATAVLPIVTQRRKLPEQKRLALTEKIIWQLRVSAAILPIILVFIVLFLPEGLVTLPNEISIAIASTLGLFTFVWLGSELVTKKPSTT